MTSRSLLLTSVLIASALVPAFGRDRDRGPLDFTEGPESPPEAASARSQAQQAYQQGNFAKTIELANWLIDNHPQDHGYVAYYLRASAKVELGQRQRSAKQLREGIADARQAVSLEGQRYPRLYSPYLSGLSSLALVEGRTEHADLAIKAVTPLLQLPVSENYTTEDRANLYYQRGAAYSARRDFKLAAADYAEAIRLNAEHVGAYIRRAEALAALGQAKEALKAYDEAVARFPNMVLVFNDRGSYRRTAGDLEGAVADFTRCLQIDPKLTVGYLNRGIALADRNEPQAAEGDFTEALKLAADPGTKALACRFRASARLGQGNVKGALSDYNAAVQAMPQDAGLYEERGLAQFFAKNFAAAGADFSRAAKASPQAVHLVLWHALSQARAGQSAEARTLLQRAREGKSPPTGWTAKILNFLLDQTSEDELLEAAAGDARMKNRQLTEARFFAGQKQLIRQNAEAAEKQFREAIGLNDYLSAAYRGSRYELAEFK